MTKQEKEIKTIKERAISLKLSDADCERISRKAGKHGLTVAELLENFVGDLVQGTYSNGSDERERAEQWFERCWFGAQPEETLLLFLLDCCYDVDDFLNACNKLKYFQENPTEFEEEIKEFYSENHWYEVIKIFAEKHQDADIEKEIQMCREWYLAKEKLKTGGAAGKKST